MIDLKKLNHHKIYIWLLILTAISLPTSKALMSIVPFFILLNWLWEGKVKEKLHRAISNPAVGMFSAVFMIYLLGLLWSDNLQWGLHDIKIQIPLLFLPLVIGTSQTLKFEEIKTVLIAFTAAIVFSSVCSTLVRLGLTPIHVHDIRQISLFISHIRFALLINICIFSLGWLLYNSSLKTKKSEKILCVLTISWLIVFLFILSSLTGVVIFFLVSIIIVYFLIFKIKARSERIFLLVTVSLVLPILASFYVIPIVQKIYRIEKIPGDAQLMEKTKLGNPYLCDTSNKQIENGHYVFLYICEEELRQAWNERSSLNYDTVIENGYNKYILFRYLTSKGFRKDAEGLSKLNSRDITNIENGITNYRFTSKFSLSKRIYQTIYEISNCQAGFNPEGSSLIQRIEYTKIAWSVIKENFWFGVGTGGYYPAFQKKYDEHSYFKSPKYRQRSHNMFLSYWVDFGLIGLIFICFLYIYPIFRQKKQRSFLLLVFCLIVFLSFINEDTLNNHDAIVFFTFFYPLFLFSQYENGPLKE